MAERSNASSNSGLYFLVGGLVVAVGVIAFMYFGGPTGGHTSKLEITVEASKTMPANRIANPQHLNKGAV